MGVVDADVIGPPKVHVQGYGRRRFILNYYRRPGVTILQNQWAAVNENTSKGFFSIFVKNSSREKLKEIIFSGLNSFETVVGSRVT